MNAFYPNPKIICMLRDLLDILCSMERNFRKAGLRDPGMVNHSEMLNTSLEKRLDHWMASPPVGLAMGDGGVLRVPDWVRAGRRRHASAATRGSNFH